MIGVEGRDVWYDDLIRDVSNKCEPEEMNAEDPLFILYTSGSTGKPKGSFAYNRWLHGLCIYDSSYIFNYKPKDIYWCTADIGWVTGHSYIIYGPLANGATTNNVLKEFQPILTAQDGGKLLINTKLIFFIQHPLILEL